jgi:hypothetical protein
VAADHRRGEPRGLGAAVPGAGPGVTAGVTLATTSSACSTGSTTRAGPPTGTRRAGHRRPDQQVRRVLLAVDPVQAVVDEAVTWGADLGTHHPRCCARCTRWQPPTEGPRGDHAGAGRRRPARRAHERRRRRPGVSDALATALADRPPAAAAGWTRTRWTSWSPSSPRPTPSGSSTRSRRPGPAGSATTSGARSPRRAPARSPCWPGPTPRSAGWASASRWPRPGSRWCSPGTGVRPWWRHRDQPTPTRSRPSTWSSWWLGRCARSRPGRHLGRRRDPGRLRRSGGGPRAPATAAGVRVGGDQDRPVRTVAVCGGAGDDLFAQVRAAGWTPT